MSSEPIPREPEIIEQGKDPVLPVIQQWASRFSRAKPRAAAQPMGVRTGDDALLDLLAEVPPPPPAPAFARFCPLFFRVLARSECSPHGHR